jgi:hypothetical protein
MPKMTLKEGCPGCQNRWDGYQEGQCSRCRRCLVCCGRAKVPFSCTSRLRTKKARMGQNWQAHQTRSEAAYNRFITNTNILHRTRKIGV